MANNISQIVSPISVNGHFWDKNHVYVTDYLEYEDRKFQAIHIDIKTFKKTYLKIHIADNIENL